MSLPWRVLQVPKRGHHVAENEDAWAGDPARRRFAVADGASEASWAGLWARLLTEAFVAARRPWDDPAWLDGARRAWAAQVDDLDLPWYAEQKRAEGAFAAFVGLSVRPPRPDAPGRWRALGVGDSCLLRVRPGCRPRAFPLTRSEQFGNQPHLVGSRGPVPDFADDRGSCLPGDRLYLATDALAQWFLRCCEAGSRPWDALDALLAEPEDPDAFAGWVDAHRDRDELRNDDVTVLAVGPLSGSVEDPRP